MCAAALVENGAAAARHARPDLGVTRASAAPAVRHPGDTLTVSVEVIAVREDKRLLTLRTDCINQDGAVVLTGEATVKYAKEAGAI